MATEASIHTSYRNIPKSIGCTRWCKIDLLKKTFYAKQSQFLKTKMKLSFYSAKD